MIFISIFDEFGEVLTFKQDTFHLNFLVVFSLILFDDGEGAVLPVP